VKIDTWVWYVVFAGLSWGTYVPLIFYGGSELGGKSGSRMLAVLCVGVAYFVIAIILPLVLFVTGKEEWPDVRSTGLVFSGLAGIAGVMGALCVIFASKAAISAAKDAGLNPAAYRIYIAPLIFCMAPVINTLVSLVWHPQPGNPWHFGFENLPGWKLVLGIVFVAAGAFLVLLSKEEAEQPAAKPAPVSAQSS